VSAQDSDYSDIGVSLLGCWISSLKLLQKNWLPLSSPQTCLGIAVGALANEKQRWWLFRPENDDRRWPLKASHFSNVGLNGSRPPVNNISWPRPWICYLILYGMLHCNMCIYILCYLCDRIICGFGNCKNLTATFIGGEKANSRYA